MDANRESQIRDLVEAALHADAVENAARAALDAAEKSKSDAFNRRMKAASDLSAVLKDGAIRYGDRIIRVCNRGSGPELIIQPIETIPVVAPPVPPKPEPVTPPPKQPVTAAPTKTGPVPTLGKK